MGRTQAIAILGDDIEDRAGGPIGAAGLRALVTKLEAAYPTERLGRFVASDGRVVGLIDGDADPLRAVMVGGLADRAPRIRWALVAGLIGPGRAAAPRRAGALLAEARETIALARARRDHLSVRTGEPGADRLLLGIAPLLTELLDGLSDHQRTVARMILVEGLRQADVADRLGVSRATVSVMYGRGRIRSIERLAGVIRAITDAARDALADADADPGAAEALTRPPR